MRTSGPQMVADTRVRQKERDSSGSFQHPETGIRRERREGRESSSSSAAGGVKCILSLSLPFLFRVSESTGEQNEAHIIMIITIIVVTITCLLLNVSG